MKIKYTKIAKSLTGISTPVFGISWNPPETDREIVRKLITFFEDRRALYNPFNIETPMWVAESVVEIRKRLTDTIEMLEQNSDIALNLRAMRAACRKFMDETDRQNLRRHFHTEDLFTALGELRAILGINIAQLCVRYGIDIESDLAKILPVEDEAKKKHKIKKVRTR